MPTPKRRSLLRRDEILIRGVQKNKLDWDVGRGVIVPTLANFKLRGIDLDGLSVERKAFTNYEKASQNGRFVGFVGITVGELQDLNLTVNLKENSRSGGLIIGLPPFSQEDEAEEWAIRLRDAFDWDRLPPSIIIERVKRERLRAF